MASSKSTINQLPSILLFKLVDGMELQVNVSGFSNGHNAKVDIQLKNCSRAWILHWGCTYHGSTKWVFPADFPPGTAIYKQVALQTPFIKRGDVDVIVIELRDPTMHAIEFVLKDGRYDKWLKLNQGNFQIPLPKHETSKSTPPVPKDLIEQKAYRIWENNGRPLSSPTQQKQNYDDALRELQDLLSKGRSLNVLRNDSLTAAVSTKVMRNKDKQGSDTPYSFHRRNNVINWLHKYTKEDVKKSTSPCLALTDVVEKSIGRENVILRQNYHVGNYEIVVLLKLVRGDYHILVAGNTRGATLLHWGVSKLSPKEWLAPSPEILPEKSKLIDSACQTYFMELSTENGSFQFVDINVQKKNLVGIQFVIWSAGSWINNNGTNFIVGLNPSSRSGKVINSLRNGECIVLTDIQIEHDGSGIIKWLLDEIYNREKEAERSLMHRFSIATELTERCKSDGELGLIGILTWMRFMTVRQLTWNRNYNVKPREISEAQDKFTNLLQKIYLNQPNDREIVRLIMVCVGRGGQGYSGQKIRDEILLVQRNNDCKGGMMEEWHQKLHNNSSPDDVVICEALLNYVRCGFRIEVYWKTLKEKGITKEILASYDRPILSEPQFRIGTKEGLIHDLTSYLQTLKAVYSSTDLESAIDTCLAVSGGYQFLDALTDATSLGGLTLKLQDSLRFIKEHISDKNIQPLMEKLLDCRIELRPALLMSHRKAKDLLFLDLSLEASVRTTMERGLRDLNSADLREILFFTSLVLENFCLSTVKNEELIYCLKDWYRVSELYIPNDGHWALQAKAVLDRIQLAISEKSESYHKMIQPSVQYLGALLSVEKWVIDIFTEELVRAGSAGNLSMLVNRLDPILRKIAHLGCWQIISPVEVCGFIFQVNELITIQNKVFKKPTIIIANKVSGEEEIPSGAVAVLTCDMPDVLAHVSIRARNSKVLFASCFDINILKELKQKDGKAVSIHLKSGKLLITEISSSNLSIKSISSSSRCQGLFLNRKRFTGKYAISLEEFTSEMVGAKSINIRFLSGRVPPWIKLPVSVALPFGVFEATLSDEINEDKAKKIYDLSKLVNSGDLSILRAIQDTVQQMKAPVQLVDELKRKMKFSTILWPGNESVETWNRAWEAIKRVWASKWNERAYISCRKASLNHSDLCMAVLIQKVIRADYAFVIHTKNPLSGDTSEIYTEVVKGLGETLVGDYSGRAMSFITKKANLKFHTVLGYPSKGKGLYIKESIIFRSDSNGEDLHGFAGAGLYDSVTMDKEEEVVLDYSIDPMVVDTAFQASLFSRIAEAGKIIEGLFGYAQDIEGVVKGGELYVVQSRPQI